MKKIHNFFQPGGKLFEKLDKTMPLRRPEFADSVRGAKGLSGNLNGYKTFS